ncbi:transcription factor xanC [Aspergillus puulaauensis]|uniref:BZIP domain-containing protein n=1 Tax=Aspergillus puulaauensis TaxID=1220207 RepID=A0A7R7XVU2_9EURO|nr:uncharacterized protein APUU_60921A [Aspergillus puulaauensis]BCS27873.1 hypothetical protein APUU_60921A [Aspergillus puulaauensis]
MPAKHHSPEQSESLKQDPTERRRLQNRLSQRNHRRKIRDRIAKLQERVIASELRAAATLHGWHSAPCIPYEVKPSPSSTSSSLSLSPSSPPAELQCPPASYNVGLNTMPQLPLFSTPGENDETGTTVSSVNGSGTSSPTALVPPDIVTGSALGLGQGYGLDTVQMCEQWGFQGSVYLATDTADSWSVVERDYTAPDPGVFSRRKHTGIYVAGTGGYERVPVSEPGVDGMPSSSDGLKT